MRSRSTLTVIPLLFAAGLIVYKTRTSLAVLSTVWRTGVIAARPEVVALGYPAAAVNVVDRSVNYFLVIWPALAFGILISAAVRAYVPADLWKRILAVHGTATQLRAGLAGAPLMLCSCCVAPIFGAVYESSARLAPALTLMLASPVLNPAALVLTFMLFGPGIGMMRLILSIAAVAVIGPSVESLFPRVQVAVRSELRDGARKESFGQALYNVLVRTVPVLVVGLVVSMILVQWLPAGAFSGGAPRTLAILFVGTLAVPLALPTVLEISLALSVLSAGVAPGAPVAFLFSRPAVQLPSLLAASPNPRSEEDPPGPFISVA